MEEDDRHYLSHSAFRFCCSSPFPDKSSLPGPVKSHAYFPEKLSIWDIAYKSPDFRVLVIVLKYILASHKRATEHVLTERNALGAWSCAKGRSLNYEYGSGVGIWSRRQASNQALRVINSSHYFSRACVSLYRSFEIVQRLRWNPSG